MFEQNTIQAARAIIKDDWSRGGYYDAAEKQLEVFWTDNYPFHALFRRLVLDKTVELACGHGRHTAQVADKGGHFTLLDINEINVDFCRDRFRDHSNVVVLLCDGSSLSNVNDASCTALFCYDAMVHFEMEDVLAYLKETFRVLQSGGQALLHFSNYDRAPGGSYHDNPHWRNFGSLRIFQHFAVRAGFEIAHIQTVSWGWDIDLDGVALLRKP